MEFHLLEFVEIRTKVHRLDEGYVHILKMSDFTEDPKGGGGGEKKSHFLLLFLREREGEEENSKTSFDDPWSSIYWNSLR